MYLRSTIFYLLLLFLLFSCDVDTGQSKVFNRQIQFQYSPDKKSSLEIYEAGIDSVDCATQVIVKFKNAGAGVYSVTGINKGIKAYWKDNSTIVIETFKKYKQTQKEQQVQNFNNIVNVEYIEN